MQIQVVLFELPTLANHPATKQLYAVVNIYGDNDIDTQI